MNKPLVSIIIINWNGEEVIRKCLSSIFEQNYKEVEVIVLDNNSADESIKIIKEFEHIKLIENSKNIGFAQGNNIACREATGKYILLLNNDTEVTKKFLVSLVNILEKDSKAGIVQPKILYKNNSTYKGTVINSIGSFFTSTGFLYHFGYGKNQDLSIYNKRKEIFSAYGACMLIRKELIDKNGIFDPDFFVYFEESDFCITTLIRGYKIIFEPSSVIYHRGGISARKQKFKDIYFHSFKNRICSYIKNLEIKTLLRILPLHLLICELMAFLNLFLFKYELFLSIQNAIFWNLKMLPRTLAKRGIIQKRLRRVDDASFLSIVEKNPRLSYYIYLLKGLDKYKD